MIDIQKIELENHLDFFVNKNTSLEKSAKAIYENTKDIIQDLRGLILSTLVGKRLEKELEYFIKEDKIILGSFESFKGRLVYSKNNLYKCNISLDINHSINMLGSILVHELRHFQDFTNVFKNNTMSPISVFATEINAFRDTYEFLSEIDYINSKEYMGYPDVLKSLLKCSYDLRERNSFDISSHMSFLLEKVGYTREQQQFMIYPKISRSLDNKAYSRSTADEINMRLFS